MVRTRAENTGRRAVAAKAPRKQLGASSSGSPSSNSPAGKDKHCGGNPVRWTPTPTWQKGIGNFFGKSESKNDNSSHEQNSPSTRSETSTSEECSSNMDEIITMED